MPDSLERTRKIVAWLFALGLFGAVLLVIEWEFSLKSLLILMLVTMLGFGSLFHLARYALYICPLCNHRFNVAAGGWFASSLPERRLLRCPSCRTTQTCTRVE